MKTTTTTILDRWIGVMSGLGGRVRSEEVSLKAIELKLFPESGKALLRWHQDSFRKSMSRFLPDGAPIAVHYREYTVNDDGETVEVDTWVQSDLCEQHEWEFDCRHKAAAIGADIGSLQKSLDWGERRFGDISALKLEIQEEFKIVLD